MDRKADRRTKRQDRRKGDDRRRSGDRRGGGPFDSRRMRFSILYFFIVFLILLGINYMLQQETTESIAYSDLKQRIAGGQVSEVVVGEQVVRATVVDSLVERGAPEVWTAARVQGDEELVPLLEEAGVEYEGTTESVFGQALGWILMLGIMVLFWLWILKRMNPAQGVMRVGKNRARIVGEEGTGVDFDDVAGADEAKFELVEVVDFLRTPEKFARLGAKIPKGVLLVGPPGTGKTLLSRAVAGEAGVTFFSISGSEFVEMFVGVGASRVRDLFEQAKSNAPCIVFIDELDALGKARGIGGPMGGNEEREQTLNQLLVEMDGFDPRTGVIIMAATNRPEILDPALLRPGRFDRQVVVDRPDRQGREAILRVHGKELRLDKEVDLEVVARRTPGFVGADLANLLNEAALLAARRDHEAVTMQDIDDAIDRVIAGLEKRNRLVNEREREIVAYHEAGHAIIAERSEHADPVHKISIIPRGIGALGYTQQLERDERYLMQTGELADRLAVLLGGRAAEELIFGEISSGAANDLERATDIARRMVTEFGMSEELGPVTYGGGRGPRYLGLPDDGSGRRDYSEATAQRIDDEVRRIISEAYQHALGTLRADRDLLKDLALRLLEKEVVDRDELRELMGRPRVQPGEAQRPEVGHVSSSRGE